VLKLQSSEHLYRSYKSMIIHKANG
jgi:hypothetical protein